MKATFDWYRDRLIISLICNGKYLLVVNDQTTFEQFMDDLRDHIGGDITQLTFLSDMSASSVDVELLRDANLISFSVGEN